MKGEHKKYIGAMSKYLLPIGFSEKTNDDYSVIFENADGWKISIDSERYYEGIFISIISPKGFDYWIFLLIRVFEKQTGKKIRLSRPDDWLAFISENSAWIFQDPQPYRSCYKEMDSK